MKKRTGLWIVAVIVAFFFGYQVGGVEPQQGAINNDFSTSPTLGVLEAQSVADPTETPLITTTPDIEPTLVPTTSLQASERPTVAVKVTPAPTPFPTPSPTPQPTPVPTPEPTPTPEVRQLASGHRGDDVLELQERLVELGYNIGSPDGQFGGKTGTAVKAIQVLAGLKVTGIVDEATRSIIWSEAAPTAQPKPTAKPTPTPKPVEEDDSSDYQSDYILNKNTKKFHETWCSSVDQMKESNKVYYTGTSAGARAKGYSPCKNCDP